MFRRYRLLGPATVAFGIGLLLAAVVPAGFLILLFGCVLVVAGVCLLRK